MRDDTKTEKKVTSKFKAVYVAKVGCQRDDVCDLIKQLRQHISSAAACLRELAAVRPVFESHMTKED